MMNPNTMSPTEFEDADLVAQTLSGSRDAFGRIVARYKSLICSLAYSATGSLTQSEDLAQEIFVTAWKELPFLREPEKLRSWLCGIARNLNYRIQREDGHEPSCDAEPLDTLDDLPAPGMNPQDHTISREEEAILWKSLERIPANYREPLILFYREDHSVERVARILDLSQDTVRQRLVRGRKLLHKRVIAFVEGALEKTNPGETFTQGVLAALPLSAGSAKAVLGATVTTTGAAVAKGAASVVGPSALVTGSAFIQMGAQADEAKSPRERRFMSRDVTLRFIAAGLAIDAVYFGGRKLMQAGYLQTPLADGLLTAALLFIAFVVGTAFYFFSSRRQRQIQIEEGTYVEAEWKLARKETESAQVAQPQILKLSAVSLAITAAILWRAPWKEHPALSILLAACLVLATVNRFRIVREQPRFQAPTLFQALIALLLMSLFGLLFLGLQHFYGRPGASTLSSPVPIVAFCAVLILGYGGRLAFAAWKRSGGSAQGRQ
jgi:RNA polymerase sigma factor (sigma-70 family)